MSAANEELPETPKKISSAVTEKRFEAIASGKTGNILLNRDLTKVPIIL